MSQKPDYESRAPTEYDARISLRIPTFWCTILGLLTVGVFWGFYFAHWSSRHQKALSSISSNIGVPASRRSTILGMIMGIMSSVLIFCLIIMVFNDFEIAVEIMGPLCWLALALLAVTWGSVIFEVRRAMFFVEPHQVDSLMLSGGNGRIIIAVLLNAAIALTILPLVIFVPMVAYELNKYVEACNRNSNQARI